jgi:hypothetical protein
MKTDRRKEFLPDDPNYRGEKVIIPSSVGFEKGVNFVIKDEYEPVTIWRFKRRVKVYSEPHYTKKDFIDCDVCQKNNREFMVVPDSVLIEERSSCDDDKFYAKNLSEPLAR